MVRSLQRLDVLLVTPEDINEAMRRTREQKRSYFDALHDAVAWRAGCKRFLTEDLPGGRASVRGVAYENPLAGV